MISLTHLFKQTRLALNQSPTIITLTRPLLATSFHLTTTTILQSRNYKAHTVFNSGITGRSVPVKGRNVAGAYAQLREILSESKVRDVVRAQERHERVHDKKRRIKKQKLFDDYLVFMKKKVELAFDLKRRTEQENRDAERI